MDFQKMVRQFRENVVDENKPQPLNEMASDRYREAAEEKISQLGLLEDLSWGSLFPEAAEGTNNPAPDGRATRMILDFIPNEMKMAIEIGKKLTKLGWTPDFDEKEVTQKRTVRNDQGEEERVATKENIAQLNYTKKIEKVIPKGPRAGEKIEKTMTSKLSQLIQKHGTPEEKEFWTKEQIRFTSIDTANEYFLRPWMRQYKDKDSATAVLITRHPIDVLRLSDFSNMGYSCWSEGSDFGHCSQDEALTGGPVAFLIPKAEIEKVSLQDLHGLEEVFSDSDINSEGKTTTEPTARLRLVSLRSENGDDLAIPSKKVYGVNVPGFKDIVSDFMFDAQKDIIVRDGSPEEFIKELSDGIWQRTGGSYSDQEQYGGRIGALITDMIPVEAGVDFKQLDRIAGMNVAYDIYSGSDDNVDNLIERAQERLDTLMQEWNNNAQHVSVWMEAEQYDEDGFYIVTSADTMVSIPAPTHEQELKYGLSMIPHFENRNDFGDNESWWQYKRSFAKTIDEAVDATESINSYGYENLEVNLRDGNVEIRLTLTDADVDAQDDVDEIEYWLDQTVDDWEQNHDELRRNIIVALQTNEYLPPAEGFASAKADVSKEGLPNTFSNFDVEMMDPAKPAEGIVIGTKEQGRLNFALGVYDTVDKATGAELNLIDVLNGKAMIADEDYDLSLAKGNVRQRIQKALAAELQKLEDEAEEYAKQQLSLPLEQPTDPQGELDLGSEYEKEDEISYERKPQRVPEFDFVNSEFGFRFDPIETMENKVIIGIHMDFEVAVDATAENYAAIRAFVSYLDGSKDRLVEALQNLIQPFYEAIRASSINMQKQERERMQQKVSDAEAAGKDPLAAGAYYRQDLSEAEEESTARLYQVVLTLRVNKPIRDIAGKLNRIRAIEGVTVVSHETDEDVLHRGDIVAKVKFHVRKDSTTPMTYINQILVPEINSSQMVPEVKVLSVVAGTLKKI